MPQRNLSQRQERAVSQVDSQTVAPSSIEAAFLGQIRSRCNRDGRVARKIKIRFVRDGERGEERGCGRLEVETEVKLVGVGGALMTTQVAK